MNIRGGISTFAKWRSVIEILNAKNPDILVITETGHDNSPSTLKWLTRNMHANELNDPEARSKLTDQFKDSLPYTIHSTQGTTGEGRGGVAVLVHTSMSHRIIGKPTLPTHKRWMTITIATPDEHIKLVATYMRPSPQSNPQARAEWTELTDYAVHLGVKNNTVLIVGDLNASMNTPNTRRFPSQSKQLQERLLSSLLNAGRLVDAFPSLYPNSHYCTWWSTETWTSPDHFLISEHQAHRLKSAQIDLTTPRKYNLDHAIFSVILDISEPTRPPPTSKYIRVKFVKSMIPKYQERILSSLPETPPADMTTLGEQLLGCVADTGAHMFKKKGHQSHRSGKVLRMWNDITVLNHITACQQANEQPPANLLRRRIYREATDQSRSGLRTLRQTLIDQINSKARKRAAATRHMFRNKRSTYFSENRMGRFISLVLNRSNPFKGAIGYYNDPVEKTISTDPQSTISMVHDRVSSTFYTTKDKPEPPHFPTAVNGDLSHLPDCIQQAWRTRIPNNPLYKDVLAPITGVELRTALHKMGRNKAPGPSGITVEMLRHLPDSTLDNWLLPLVNHCLTNQVLPDSVKRFLVWCLEKKPGMGSIIHPTDKLQLRPISLFEIFSKLIEFIINRRLMSIIHQHNLLHNTQHGFRPESDVTDAMLTYSFLMEDAKSTKREIHLSNNDCTQAYDSIPHWATDIIYAIHGFPPALQHMLKALEGNLHGRILTAHGPGPSFPMERGLGQGSILAPLKWNLFLDPLLRQLDVTHDPYTIGSGDNSQALRAIAFADDMTIISSTHRGYRTRMKLACAYLNFFNVELNPQKTTYTYYNTRRHHLSVMIRTTSPSGVVSLTPTAVASPYTPLRYLGGYMCPANSWHHAKDLLHAEVKILLGILRHKKLSIKEYRYIVQSVLMSKLRYYLTVVPMTNRELDHIDAQITAVLKHNIGVATSTSSPLLHMDAATSTGLSFPSIRDIQDDLHD